MVLVVSPKALLAVTAIVPEATVTPPEKVLLPDNVKVPVPCLVIPPVPVPELLWIIPEKIVEELSPPTVNWDLCSMSSVPAPAIDPIAVSYTHLTLPTILLV